MNLSFDFFNVSVYLPETAAHVILAKFLMQREMLEAFLPLSADLDYMGGVGFDEAKELVEGVVCIADYQDRAFMVPVGGKVYQHLHNLNSDVGLTCAWWTLNEREIVC